MHCGRAKVGGAPPTPYLSALRPSDRATDLSVGMFASVAAAVVSDALGVAVETMELFGAGGAVAGCVVAYDIHVALATCVGIAAVDAAPLGAFTDTRKRFLGSIMMILQDASAGAAPARPYSDVVRTVPRGRAHTYGRRELHINCTQYPRPPFAVDASALKERRRRADTGFFSRHCVQTTGHLSRGRAHTVRSE